LPRKREKRKRSTTEIIGLIAIGIFVVGIIWLAFFTSPQTPNQTTTSVLAPDFTLTDVDGQTFRLGDQRGKVVVLEFMRTTCSACLAQEPYLRELRSRFGGGDVVMVVISVDPTTDIDEVLRDHRDQGLMGWIAIVDKAQVYKLYGVQATPTIVIIDKNGYIQYEHVGLTESSVLMKEVDNLA